MRTALSALVLTAALATPAHAATYTVTALAMQNNWVHAEPQDVTDTGYVVGRVREYAGKEKAVRWAPDGTFRDLGEWYAAAVNEDGEVVGMRQNELGWHTAVRWTPDGGRTDLPTWEGIRRSDVRDLNNRGQAAGTASTPIGRHTAVRWNPDGTYQRL